MYLLQADAGGSPSLVARGLTSSQASGVGDQLEIQVPNEKVNSCDMADNRFIQSTA